MAYINAANSADFVRVLVRVNDGSAPAFADFISSGSVTSGTLEVPALQDITITNTPSTFRWKQLDSADESVVTSVSTNAISGNLVLDPTKFFGTAPSAPGASTGTATEEGIFGLSNKKQKIDILIGLSGLSTGDRYVMASGYFSNMAPTVSADSPIWTSSYGVEIDGSYTVSTVA